MLVSCVLRQSVAFRPAHVHWLGKQIAQYLPGVVFVPCSDTPLDIPYIPLKQGWPAWWAKMEAYTQFPEDDLLMLDLDTVIVKPWAGIPVPAGKAYMPTFPNRTDKVLGCWQLSSPEFRTSVVENFYRDPEEAIRVSGGCDQVYYAKHFRENILPLRSVAPDLCASYKLQVKPHGFFSNTAFVMFHGLPRPWQLDLPWIPKLEC